MTEVKNRNALLSVFAQKKFNNPAEFGVVAPGLSSYGNEYAFIIFTGFGDATFGVDKYSDFEILSGIYIKGRCKNKMQIVRSKYYVPLNPRSISQQSNRSKFSSAVSEWQNLTDEQKAVYNKKAKRLKKTGYNYFIKRYMLYF